MSSCDSLSEYDEEEDAREREQAALQWVLDQRESSPSKLSLCVERFGADQRVVRESGFDQVRELWWMDREGRQRMWETAGRMQRAEELELGGKFGCGCPMDLQEVLMLLPSDLGQLRVLFLMEMSHTDDAWLRALADLGCGRSLQCLTLDTLGEGVTDAGLSALAEIGGCGKELTSLTLSSLGDRVTDASFSALASAGCGRALTFLTLTYLKDGVTDKALDHLASAGCGARLTGLCLWKVGPGVSDVGIRLLAEAGCGKELKELTLLGDSFSSFNKLGPPLGLSSMSHGIAPQEAYRQWRVQMDQCLFLRDQLMHGVGRGGNLAKAVEMWDHEHCEEADQLGHRVFIHPSFAAEEDDVLRWMLPMEVWQEVLGFCSFKEYHNLKASKPASREFYFLLKQSLLELRFGSMMPSPALGGLWMASRDVQATQARVLHLGSESVSSCLALEHLAEIVPLQFLRTLVVKLGTTSRGSLEEVHQRAAPFVRAPQRLQVALWEDEE